MQGGDFGEESLGVLEALLGTGFTVFHGGRRREGVAQGVAELLGRPSLGARQPQTVLRVTLPGSHREVGQRQKGFAMVGGAQGQVALAGRKHLGKSHQAKQGAGVEVGPVAERAQTVLGILSPDLGGSCRL